MIAAFLLVIAGIIHLLPLSGVMGQAALMRLYGVQISDADLLILMRHRAVLFALMGGLMIYSIFVVPMRGVAILMGLISKVSFLVIALTAKDGFGSALRMVVLADFVAIVALAGAGILTLASK